MVIEEIYDRDKWNAFLLSQPTQAGLPACAGIFLQSWDWGEFQAQLGRKVWRLGITQTITQKDTNNNTKGHELVGVCGVVKMNLPMGRSYLYAPRGPILGISNFQFPISKKISNYKSQIPEELIDYMRKISKKERAIFLRLEPFQELRSTLYALRSTPSVQPKQTLVLDLAKDREILLSEMHEKTRYNIRLADRKGVKVKTGQFEEFWKLLKKTSRRDRFSTHPRKYYERMLAVLGKEGVMRVRLHMAYFENRPVAAAIVGYFGDTVTYLHGASSYEDRALMAPYALHWDIINDAKKDGYLFYDFWGIQSPSPSGRGRGEGKHGSWEGITRFKMRFATVRSPDAKVGSGHIVNYPGAFDLPLSKFWYKVYRFGKKIF